MYSSPVTHESRKLKQARPCGQRVDLLRAGTRMLLPHSVKYTTRPVLCQSPAEKRTSDTAVPRGRTAHAGGPRLTIVRRKLHTKNNAPVIHTSQSRALTPGSVEAEQRMTDRYGPPGS